MSMKKQVNKTVSVFWGIGQFFVYLMDKPFAP